MNFFKYFNLYNRFLHNVTILRINFLGIFFQSNTFLSSYFILNEQIWQEGLLVDFLQKKITDNWLKKFVIYSANLFNERLLFDKIIKFYLDLFIWPMHKLFIFDFNNVSGMLFINLFLFFFLFLIFTYVYILFMF